MSESISEPISAAISDRICKHMNDDHGDALVLYAQTYGNLPDAEAAEMLAIDSLGMDLSVQKQGEVVSLRIPFDHPLQDAKDAHHTLVAMIQEAKQG